MKDASKVATMVKNKTGQPDTEKHDCNTRTPGKSGLCQIQDLLLLLSTKEWEWQKWGQKNVCALKLYSF